LEANFIQEGGEHKYEITPDGYRFIFEDPYMSVSIYSSLILLT
jgi:hypothetical protein